MRVAGPVPGCSRRWRFVVLASVALAAQGDVPPVGAARAARRLVADAQRRLLGPALQPADDDRQRATSRRCRSGWIYRRIAATGRRAAAAQTAVDHQGHAGRRQRRAVRHDSRSRLGASTRAADASSGTPPGRRRAAGTSATAASPCSAPRVYVETPDCQLVALDNRDGQGEVADRDLRSRAVLLRLGRAAHRQEPRHRRRQRRRPRHPRLHRVARSRRPARVQWRWYTHPEPGHARSEDVAERRGDAARRRHDVGIDDVRSAS